MDKCIAIWGEVMKHTLPVILLSCLLISGLAVAKDVPRDLQAVPGGPIISGDSAKQTCQIGNYKSDYSQSVKAE